MDLSHACDAVAAECVACDIYEDGTGGWRWEGVDVLGAVVKHSNRAFERRQQCLADAAAQGQPLPERPTVF